MLESSFFTNFLNTQIDFLVFLQNIRDTYCSSFNQYFLSITTLGEFFIPTITCGIIYWCINNVAGTFMFSVYSMGIIFAQILKMLACVYRPWVISDKIKPVEKAICYSKGYSFPSGHSAIATCTWGGIAYLLKHKIYSTILLLIVFLVMFSRMWLGVHTPQDIIVGFLIGVVLILTIYPIINWCDKNKTRYIYLLIPINIFTITSLFYVCYKPYPLDYIAGNLIVNPSSSIYAYIICCSYALGLINGAFICQKYFPFDTKNIAIKTRIFRGLIGIILIKGLIFIIDNCFFASHKDYKLTAISVFTIGFIITAIYPLIFRTAENKN